MEPNFKASGLDHGVNKFNLINTDRALMLSEDLKVIIQRICGKQELVKSQRAYLEGREIISGGVKPNRNTLY